MDQTTIEEFLARLDALSSGPTLSEAKMMVLGDADRRVVIHEDDRVVAVGVIADHHQADGSIHQAIETAVEPAMQFPAFERACLEATLAVADRDRVSVWSRRSTLDAALGASGFTVVRTLRFMTVDLPLRFPPPTARPLGRDEVGDLIGLNNLAFADHREAGALAPVTFDRIAAEPWFELEGIVVIDDDDGLVAFCWTKVHPNGDGEIYRVGVRPDRHGSGLGRAITLAGFHDLADRRGCRRGTLWVDDQHQAAVALYESLGLVTESSNREFERP
jgi:mycothiol synthase